MSKTRRKSIVLRIARTELSTLFCSPIAWFILIVFSVLTAVDFTSRLDSMVGNIEAYGGWGDVSMTFHLFLGDHGFFQKIVGNLFIYIPLLTMGLVSRELSTGSIKLAYSSPVTSWQFVTGKYLASVVMNLCLLILPLLTVLAGPLFIPHFDFAPVLVALLGIFLLACTYSAIGLFMSSVTSYQVVAAVSTLITLAALSNISRIGPGYDFTRSISHWLALSGRTSSFLTGVVRSDDIIYLIVITLLFLFLTVFRISFPRRNIRSWRKASAYTALAAAVIVAATVFSNPRLTRIYDATRNKSQSITEASKDIIRQIPGKIVINNYVNMLDNMSSGYLPAKFYRYRSVFEQYKLTRPDIEEHTIYYYAASPNSVMSNPSMTGMTVEQARDYISIVYNLNPRMYKSPESMAGVKAVQDEQGTLVHEFVVGDGRVVYIRDFMDTERVAGEAEISSALSKLISDPPLAGFVSGNGERSLSGKSLTDYSDFAVEKYSRYALVNQGFDIIGATLDSPIPEEVHMIVIADPSEPFTEGQLGNLRDYLSRGGNMLLLTDYSTRNVSEPVLAGLGLKSSDRQLAQREGDNSASLVLARVSADAEESFAGLAGRGRVTMPGSVAIDTLAGEWRFARKTLLQTGPSAWLEKDFEGFRDDMVECDSEGETLGTYATAYTLTRRVGDKEQRIAVLGDADCFSNSELTISRENVIATNYSFIIQCFRWISDGRFPFVIEREKCLDDSFRIHHDRMPAVKAVFIYIIPLLILALAAVVLLRRRKG